MRRGMLLLLLGLLLTPAWADTTITPGQARLQADLVVQRLIYLNQRAADEHFHHGELARSIALLDRIIALAPDDFESYACAAWLARGIGKDDLALQYYQRMTELFPTNPDTFFEFATFYRAKRDYPNALAQMERALRLGLPAPQRHLYGHLLKWMGRRDEALAWWRQEQAAHPTDEVATRQIQELLQPEPTPPAAPTATPNGAEDAR